jgi:hypothetical protein
MGWGFLAGSPPELLPLPRREESSLPPLRASLPPRSLCDPDDREREPSPRAGRSPDVLGRDPPLFFPEPERPREEVRFLPPPSFFSEGFFAPFREVPADGAEEGFSLAAFGAAAFADDSFAGLSFFSAFPLPITLAINFLIISSPSPTGRLTGSLRD